MHRIGSAFVIGLLLLPGMAAGQERPPLITTLAHDSSYGPRMVRVDANAALIHTNQLLTSAPENEGTNDSAEAMRRFLDLLGQGTNPVRERFGDTAIVRLNVAVVQTGFAKDLTGISSVRLGRKPNDTPMLPMSFVVGQVPKQRGLVALDGVLAIPGHKAKGEVVRLPSEDQSKIPFATICPPGTRVYVSGQAEKGADLREATRKTLESLRATLKHLELADQHILQIKAFLNPMAKVEEAREEIVRFYGDLVPPMVFVEWQSTLPIEIELIAWDPKPRDAAVEYLTPPGMKASPVYSRVARIGRGPSLYFTSLYGGSAENATAETEDIFKQMEGLLAKGDSDMRHLVKATYYVSTDEASQKLNELRPRWYDPTRPPAASKAMVPGVGREGRTISVDMIAVPKRR